MTTLVPPIKCQGIKTKLIPFIKDNLDWDGEGIWYEPFLGSGVVLFNVCPDRAYVSDRNEHIINFYKALQAKDITAATMRDFLEEEAPKLEADGVEYYYEVRNRFNELHSPYDLIFLNRACFNGIMRFNKKGGFNVPFCQKPNRFAKAYITKICNQIDNVQHIIEDRDWTFVACDWKETMKLPQSGDCVYLDPPYLGRDTNYVGEWPESEAVDLADAAHQTDALVYLSMWKENKYRFNEHIPQCWGDFRCLEYSHFYHVGSKESLRNAMTEALLVKPGN